MKGGVYRMLTLVPHPLMRSELTSKKYLHGMPAGVKLAGSHAKVQAPGFHKCGPCFPM